MDILCFALLRCFSFKTRNYSKRQLLSHCIFVKDKDFNNQLKYCSQLQNAFKLKICEKLYCPAI